MSPTVSRRQPIYRLVCMVDVTSSESAAHQPPATQGGLTSASQRRPRRSVALFRLKHTLFPLAVLLLRCSTIYPGKKDQLRAFTGGFCRTRDPFQTTFIAEKISSSSSLGFLFPWRGESASQRKMMPSSTDRNVHWKRR